MHTTCKQMCLRATQTPAPFLLGIVAASEGELLRPPYCKADALEQAQMEAMCAICRAVQRALAVGQLHAAW